MEKYHGKILYFDSNMGREDTQKFLNSLPRRNDFVDKDKAKQVDGIIADEEPVFFMPNSIVEQHVKDENNLCYKLVLIGILRDGSKAAVVINQIIPFFDIRVPAGIEASEFLPKVQNLMKQQTLFPTKFELIQKFPFKYFHEDKVNYYRIYFNTLHARNKAIRYFEENKFTYVAILPSDGGKDRVEERKVKLETASDDKSCYYRKAAREFKFKLCDWNVISNYTLIRDDSYMKKHCVKYTFSCHVDDFNPIQKINPPVNLQDPQYKDLLKDKSMVMTWDIETDAGTPTGNVPDPEKVFNDRGDEEDVVFMHASTFHWYYTNDMLVKVNITTMPAPARPDCLLIIVKHQTDIIKVKSLIVERMAPEFLTGFNDGIYDWPFILRRAEQFDKKKGTALMEFMKKHMSVIPYTPQNAKYTIGGPKKEHIKVEADTYVDNEFFDVPGFICMDTRTIFRQLYPTAEKTSLNFFLAANKLGSKEDMEYQTMFKIYRMLRQLRLMCNTSEFQKIYDTVIDWRARKGDNYKPFKDIKKDDTPKDMLKIDNTLYTIEKLNVVDILALLDQATLVVHYCNIDAQRCQELLKIRNIIADRREVSNLSYTSMFDALFRAGGMKVRNLVISEGIEAPWDLVFTNIAKNIKDTRKYPGAYVVPPKKGLYRDHVSVKRRRRENYQSSASIPKQFDIAEVTPGNPAFKPELLNPEFDKKYPPVANATASAENNDINDKCDRPCTGLDFSSLYPSLIMTYNLSPEKVIVDPKFKAYLEKRIDRYGLPYKLLEVDFLYGHPDEADEKKEHVHGWVVQHHPVEKPDPKNPAKKIITDFLGMGLYPYILKKLYDMRAAMKVQMERYAGPKEFLNKVGERRAKAKLSKLGTAPLEEQKKYLHECLEEEKEARRALYEKTKKGFHKWQMESFKEIEEFFEEEFLKSDKYPSIDKLSEEIDFQFNYYNCKQNALKVFMNTFYGETGNSQSPFFLIHVAGGITTNGQRNIKAVKGFVENNGYRVLYGDTDSLYLCCPERYFVEVDKLYEEGKIDRATYWTRMVEITMETLDKFKNEVNEFLYRDNGTRFLKMAYEEVLWPFMMVGKKKYVGIQHQNIPNFAACMPEISLEDFMKSKSLFIRGLELKKRGSSEFLKRICYEIIKEAFCITSVKTLKEIVEDKLKEIPTRNWNPELFVKTARYKLPGKDLETGKPKPGNVTVKRFVERMTEIEQQHPETGVKSPEIGERFPYIVAQKYPWSYDLRGRKVGLKVGDKYEYATSLKNEKYQQVVGKVNIDLDHYITNEIIGQLARFIIYHPDYDHFFDALKAESENEEIEKIYKAADQKAHNEAKKILREFYKSRFAKNYTDKGEVYKRVFKKTNDMLSKGLINRYGDAFTMFNITNTFVTNYDLNAGTDGADAEEVASFSDKHMREELKNKIISEAQKIASKRVQVYIKDIVKQEKINPFKLYTRYVAGPTSICKIRRRVFQKKIDDLKRELDDLVPEFQKVCAENVQILTSLVNEIRRQNCIDNPEMVDDEMVKSIDVDEDQVRDVLESRGFRLEDNDSEDEIAGDVPEEANEKVYDLYDLFIRLIAEYRNLYEVDEVEKEIAYYKTKSVKGTAVPPSVQKEMKAVTKGTVKDDFSEWLKKKNNYNHV